MTTVNTRTTGIQGGSEAPKHRKEWQSECINYNQFTGNNALSDLVQDLTRFFHYFASIEDIWMT